MIHTWEQLNFGGNAIMFHSETIGNHSHTWECCEEECDICHTYLTSKEDTK